MGNRDAARSEEIRQLLWDRTVSASTKDQGMASKGVPEIRMSRGCSRPHQTSLTCDAKTQAAISA